MNAKEQSMVQSQGSSSSTAVVDGSTSTGPPSRYESQKRRDWNTFGQYLKNHRPPLALSKCSGAHVLEFLRYLDQFGKTKVHVPACPFFGHPQPPAPCGCPLKQAWGSLDALIGRLRAAYEENGGRPESNPFGARAVRLYLREVRDLQSKARGIAYEKKKRKRPQVQNVQAQQQLQAPPHQSQSQTQTQMVPQQPPPSYPNFMNPHHHHHLQALASLPPPHQSLSAAIGPGGGGGGGGGSVLNNVGVGPSSQHHPFLSSASMMMHLHHNS